jgi:hypothetical protein
MPLCDNDQPLCTTGYFALACEKMNDYGRALRAGVFDTVKSSANIRYYEQGWRLEKCVEAELNRAEGLWAAWWLEFGPSKGGWIIESSVSVSPDVLHYTYESRFVTSVPEFAEQIDLAVGELKVALQENQSFAEEVQRIRQRNI